MSVQNVMATYLMLTYFSLEQKVVHPVNIPVLWNHSIQLEWRLNGLHYMTFNVKVGGMRPGLPELNIQFILMWNFFLESTIIG